MSNILSFKVNILSNSFNLLLIPQFLSPNFLWKASFFSSISRLEKFSLLCPLLQPKLRCHNMQAYFLCPGTFVSDVSWGKSWSALESGTLLRLLTPWADCEILRRRRSYCLWCDLNHPQHQTSKLSWLSSIVFHCWYLFIFIFIDVFRIFI